MQHVRIISIVCFIMSLCSSQTWAETFDMPLKPFALKGEYVLKYAALPIGQVQVDATENNATFSMDAHAKLVGVAKLFSDHESTNKVSGSFSTKQPKNFNGATREFQTRYTSKDGWRTIALGYTDGKLVKEEVEVTHEMSYRPKVSLAQKNQALDTMTMVFALRHSLHAALQQKTNNVSLNYFDGKRLTKISASIYGQVARKYNGLKTPVIKVGLRREPIAGYTPKELKRSKESKLSEMLIYFTANDDFTPILGEAATSFGTFRAELK